MSLPEAEYEICHVAALTLRAQFQKYLGKKERRRYSIGRLSEV